MTGGGTCCSLLLEVSTGNPTCSNRGAREELKLMVVSVGETDMTHTCAESRGAGERGHTSKGRGGTSVTVCQGKHTHCQV
jgi:hypothetical protein